MTLTQTYRPSGNAAPEWTVLGLKASGTNKRVVVDTIVGANWICIGIAIALGSVLGALLFAIMNSPTVLTHLLASF